MEEISLGTVCAFHTALNSLHPHSLAFAEGLIDFAVLNCCVISDDAFRTTWAEFSATLENVHFQADRISTDHLYF